MRALSTRSGSALVFALVLALLLLAAPPPLSAAGPSLTVHGTGVARCNDSSTPVASIVQGEDLEVSFADFPGAHVMVTLIFPDKRVFTPEEAAKLDGRYNLLLGGAPDPQPLSLSPVDSSQVFQSLETWPTGCYAVNAESGGLEVDTKFVVLAKSFPPQPGNLQLNVQTQGTYQPKGAQGETISIFGRGIPDRPLPRLYLVQPNGSIICLPPVSPVANSGNFTASYTFEPSDRTGVYTFVAVDTTPNGPMSSPNASTYSVSAQFELKAPPSGLETRAPINRAVLTLDPFTTLVERDQRIVFQGRRFGPTAAVEVFLVLPDGARFLLNPQGGLGADPSGNVTFSLRSFSRYFPSGSYKLLAYDDAGKAASVEWRLKDWQSESSK